jgi:hypothetical protein
MSTYKIPVRNQLQDVAAGIKFLLKLIRKGEPNVYLMGHKYPEDINELLEHGSSWAQLDYAIGDLVESKRTFSIIVQQLREYATDLNEAADVLEGRDLIVDMDIVRLKESMEKMRTR